MTASETKEPVSADAIAAGGDADSALERLSVEGLKRVGPKVAERLARLNVRTIQDLLLHFPLRYQDRTRLVPIGALVVGAEALIEGEVVESTVVEGRRRSLKVWLSDGPAQGLVLRFFHFSASQAGFFRPGIRLRCYGEVRPGQGALEMIHPEYRVQTGDVSQPDACLTPVYPTTEGLSQSVWRALMDQALEQLGRSPLSDCLPRETLGGASFSDLAEALVYLHRPPVGADLDELQERRHPAFLRLAFEELVAHQVGLRRMRLAQRKVSAPILDGDGGLRQALRRSLPFALTPAQERVLGEISADLAEARPMQRLLQGDVGSGKTVVAALAALQALEAGWQVALMAPTELLSEQHHRTLAGWLEPLGIQVRWLTGRHKGQERADLLDAIASGEARLIVGTHALFQDSVRFAGLGLVIIDEQHRFGVHQRMKLREKGADADCVPHQLIMTATPIPRSLAMTFYADLDLSVIDTLPPGRTPITTVAVPEGRRDEVIERVRRACEQGRQVYWVCTLIEESEALQCQAAEESACQLAELLPDVRVGLVHGRVKPSERESVMGAFARGELGLLVATTVIEVGVDVPNASLMIIENAERLGLAQLHQLRGRVGRGSVESHCLLLYRAPLSEVARERLGLMRSTCDGFLLAERDLQMRGAGEVLGTRQTGAIQLRVADPLRDQHLVAPAQRAADLILARYPDLVSPLIDRWLGDRELYGQV
ncbi:ATP-dependent DNA helicase RecG [Thiorhodococcus drewsii AZ1]|uniref:ATP-dependent DNA helicase RecG n=1 Tax=Thiorhodococcus drewsii AZ1 TaxID=765913 RepID=G2E093_9GAMM|nr:ATP-dependent DNA helicase RecG [Thiorhodococcus drewsii]EGV31821.1 ATP-dependent DNA helicase RecG [Thiorhodococcus drewsii AZ1]